MKIAISAIAQALLALIALWAAGQVLHDAVRLPWQP